MLNRPGRPVIALALVARDERSRGDERALERWR
jgi:hypothetical protein